MKYLISAQVKVNNYIFNTILDSKRKSMEIKEFTDFQRKLSKYKFCIEYEEDSESEKTGIISIHDNRLKYCYRVYEGKSYYYVLYTDKSNFNNFLKTFM